MTTQALPAILIAASVTALAACSAGPSQAASSANVATPAWAASVGSKVDRELDQAATDLATKNITLSDRDANGKLLPKAEITPTGGLIIAGKAVPLTAAQRADSLAYRQQLVAIAQQGMIIGGEGAKLGVTAAGAALSAIFSGQSAQQIDGSVKAKAAGIKQAAQQLCHRLPALLAAQQKLAASVPAFRPYATATQHDVEQCDVNTSNVHVTH